METAAGIGVAVLAALTASLGAPLRTPATDAGTPAAEIAPLRPAPRAARPAASTEALVLRRRAIDLDLAALRRASEGSGARLRFDLFDDVVLRGVIERVYRRGTEDFTLEGRIEGEGGDFLLVVDSGRVSGGFRPGGGRSFAVGSDVEGRAIVEEHDLDRFPPCAGALVADRPALSGQSLRDDPSVENHLPGVPDPPDLIDVLVAYTERAEIAAGGPAAARALAQRSVDEANVAYRNSGIDTRLRLVWRGRTSYDESLDSHLTHLQRLASPTDGFMDELHALRNAVGADVVSLFVDDAEAAGLGYLMQSPSSGFQALAFSVVYFFAASNNLTLAHEIGHNQGCEHDRENATANPAFHDAYGWRFVGNDGLQYRTVMGHLPGRRIPHFSNPDVLFQGQPTGRANKENNAHAINATAVTVANFRPRRHHPGSVRDFDGNGSDDLQIYDDLAGTFWIGLSRDGGFDTFPWGGHAPSAGWQPPIEGDFDGDGWKDLASLDASAGEWWVSLSRGDRFETLLWEPAVPGTGWVLERAGDFDGDGRDDVAGLRAPGAEWWVFLSDGQGFSSSSWGSLPATVGWTDAVVGDFNGDGRDDLATYRQAEGEWWVGLSSGSGFTTVLWHRHASAPGWTGAAAGDFSGDGRDDLAQFRQTDGVLWVGVSTGSGFDGGAWAGFPPGEGRGPLLSGDFDGDGTADLASFGDADSSWSVSLSTGSTFTTAIWSDLPPGPGWTLHRAGDFNGDGRMDVADYLVTMGEWWVGLSSGAHFDVSLWGRFVLPRSDVDTDGDGVFDAEDCDPTGADAWEIPGEAGNLLLDQPDGAGGATRLRWSEPAFKGGTQVHYDVLRSISPMDFGWGAVACLETNDGTDREALDATPPAPILFYLVRSGNACGEGSLGVDSQGVPRSGVSCP